ncbi:M20 family metallopeptidase [Serratia fonticola]|uniref:M20 family metallopeptidase n=1 Tax=Serratia fonticola TaxID=47917 RepID=A0AAW3WK23_SERFO|nr:M20 family metallopeptidase [Serratia fonticola]MBC3211081.1 M20 family metallopeptidase [Serratia fonticola]NYA12063.1 M20 family metallopeptidase [Serratia fonticola]NYA31642.1 M20 family metallopeptidase [Serratia fonticola]
MQLDDYLAELASLVNVDCGTNTLEGVATVAANMHEKYQQLGWHSEIVDLGDKVGPGVFAANKPNSPHFDVLLVGHLDTVFPVGTVAMRPMSIKEDRAYGPGVADMKSGLLNILWAMRELSAEVKERLSIAIAMNPDEETGSVYSHEWIGALAKRSRCVLVCEAARADGSLVKARKGMARYVLEFHGVAAHAGNDPDNGRSAINEMAHWILHLNQLANAQLGTTLNVGVVSGGSAANVVADYAQAIVDVRFWQNDEFERVDRLMRTTTPHCFTADVRLNVTLQAHVPAMSPSEKTEQLMAKVESAGRLENIDVRWQAVGGGSDANHTAALGIPSLDGFGPVGAGFHSPAEYLELSSIEPRVRLLRRVIETL